MIKFRAWDKMLNRYRKDEILIIQTGELWGYDAPYYEELDEKIAENIVIEQSTGLFDENGKEIFEGDVLSTDLERPYLVVERHNTYFLYQCNDGKEDYYDTMLSVSEKHIKQDMTVEVIGNIHEHKHLLDVDHENL